MLKNKRLNVPKDYLTAIDKAFLTFQFQVVYSPQEGRLTYLRDSEDSLHSESLKDHSDLAFLGELYEGEILDKIVKGDVDPSTHEEITIREDTITAIEKTLSIFDKKGGKAKKSRYGWKRKSKRGLAGSSRYKYKRVKRT